MSKVNPEPGTLPAAPTCLQGYGEHPASSRALPWQRLINLAGNDDMSCNLTGGLQSDRSVHIESLFLPGQLHASCDATSGGRVLLKRCA